LQSSRILQARGLSRRTFYQNINFITVRMNEQQTLESGASQSVSRRRFLGYAGALAGVGLLASSIACQKEEDPMAGALDLGGGDTGVMNLVYSLAQLQAAFYTMVILKPYNGMTASEKAFVTEIRDHEIAHREFFKKVLSGGALQDLTPDFSGVDFAKRTSVLDTAKFFEDLSVSAYNGAAKLLNNDTYLQVAGKIVSVEARHAALIRDLIQMGTFTDDASVDQNGLDFVRDPADVLFLANAYFKERLNPKNLPTS
jgi:hypothetical protein